MKAYFFTYTCLFFGFMCDDILATLLPVRPSSLPSCPSPSVKNLKIKRRNRGRFIKFVCNPGYLLVGEKYSTCTYPGKWDPVPPRCVRPSCTNKVAQPINGLIYPTHNGAALHFFCKSGYDLRGPSDVFCDGFKWSNNAPTCIPNNTKPLLFCDFESDDICGWTHDLNHDFDWRRHNYNTPSGSIGTGPSYDHTKGPGKDGHYMYIEATSKNENETARLISPIFDKTITETCLEFFYHMYGATTGTLRVYLKKTTENWSLRDSQLVFSKTGNQGDKWYRSVHSLGIISQDYQIVIEGIRGPGYVSDIAIDDVRIIENCVYEDEAVSTTTEIYYGTTEGPLVIESCENRCGLKASTNETHDIRCDCDDACYFASACCPDYLDLCYEATTTEDYSTTTDISNEIPSEKPIPTTTTKKPTTTTQRTLSTLKTTTKKPRFIPIYPTVKVLKPPTTPTIIRKTLTTIAPVKVTYVAPTPNKQANNDVEEVPRRTDDDKEAVFTPVFSDEAVSKEVVSEIDKTHGNYVRNFSESDKLASRIHPEGGSYNLAFVLIGVVGVGVLTTIVAVFVARRYRFSRKRMNSSNGDSQSDVRFLTNDEVLDFSLDREYDDL